MHRLETHDRVAFLAPMFVPLLTEAAVEIELPRPSESITPDTFAAKPVLKRKLDFEHQRLRWLRECMAEATGVSYYVFPWLRRHRLLHPQNHTRRG